MTTLARTLSTAVFLCALSTNAPVQATFTFLPGVGPGQHFFSRAYGVSGSGALPVGSGSSGSSNAEAAYWSSGVAVGLGSLCPTALQGFAYDASFDGSVVVGVGGWRPSAGPGAR